MTLGLMGGMFIYKIVRSNDMNNIAKQIPDNQVKQYRKEVLAKLRAEKAIIKSKIKSWKK